MRKLFLVLLLGCAACTTQAQDPGHKKPAPAVPAPAAASDTLASIRAMIGDAACTDSRQCKTLAVGARACGGPEAYLPYSTAKSPDTRLRALAERYQQERRADNTASGMMSTCQFMVDPGAVCSSGACQLGGSVPGAR